MRRNNYLLLALMIGSFGANMVRCQVSPEPAPPKTSRPGVLLLAHGGHVQTWNEEVRHVADRVDLTIPTEIAFGMASKATIQDGINRLIARGVTEIVAVPLFVSSHSSVIEGTAYLLGLRADAPEDLKDFVGMDHGASSMPAAMASGTMTPGSMANDSAKIAEQMKPIVASVPIRMTAALDHDELVAQILVDRAASISQNPSREVVILVAHGPVPDDDNKLWLSDMKALGDQMKKHSTYAGIVCLTLRDDAEDPVKNAATEELRQTVGRIHKAGNTPLVVPLLLSYGGIEEGLRKRLSGMDFKMPSQALLPDPRIAAWVTARATNSSTDSVARK